MTATKIDGTAIARSIRERLGGEIKKKQETNPRYKPSLKIVQGKRGCFVDAGALLTRHSWRQVGFQYVNSHRDTTSWILT
jgi:hypothetical protein